MAQVDTETIRADFFNYLFEGKGYLCIAVNGTNGKSFREQFFKWPDEKDQLATYLNEIQYRNNVWFCTSLLDTPKRKKEFCLPSRLLWADLDTCDPKEVDPPPQCIIQSSPHRWQAIWRLDTIMEPYAQEDLNRRIAYKYHPLGADISGWDLTQLLRVPFTHNYKYEVEGENVPGVHLLQAADTLAPIDLFTGIEKPKTEQPGYDEITNMPDVVTLSNPDDIIQKYWLYLKRTDFLSLFDNVPDENQDWSTLLWHMLNIGFEAGMQEEEVFACAMKAGCNKYVRDGRPPVHLWRDVLRARATHTRTRTLDESIQALVMPDLVDPREPLPPTFIDDYKDWAVMKTDAPEEYHELLAAMLFSAICAGGIVIQGGPRPMHPNLWGLILGESTVSRKSSAMNLMIDLLDDVDDNVRFASEGSTEGLLTQLSLRPYRTNLYFKDEFAGFVSSYKRKDYLRDIRDIFTNLYDTPKSYKRILVKNTIYLQSCIFMILGAGIPEIMFSEFDKEDITSGFLPRFLIINAEINLEKLKWGVGTPKEDLDAETKREYVFRHLRNLRAIYGEMIQATVGGVPMGETPVLYKASFTEEAATYQAKIEELLMRTAMATETPELAVPVFTRLNQSMIKLAALFAATDKEPVDRKIEITEVNVKQACRYIQRWGRHSIEMLLRVGASPAERRINRALKIVEKLGTARRSDLAQRLKLQKFELTMLIETMEDRGLIVTWKEGKGIFMRKV